MLQVKKNVVGDLRNQMMKQQVEMVMVMEVEMEVEVEMVMAIQSNFI